jgi:DNA-binding CsgD family transcriptional regulator/tetratricopeptide (TPR) repeat protein
MKLLERDTQLEQLLGYLREAGTRGGKIAFVCGEAGAGKSTLIEQFAQQAPRGTRVVWGHCDALQTSRVLGPVNEVAAEIARQRDAANEEIPSRERLFATLFDQLCAPQPTSLVVLEDLHWADEATLDFLRFIGRRIQRTRCLLVATFRDDEIAPAHPLRGILGELTGQHTIRVRVPALSLEAVEELARGTHRDAQRVYAVTAGNPFFVRELLSAPADTIPETVRDAVLARLLQCSAGARELAELVSLLPGKTDLWLARSLLGDLDTHADEAVERGLLRYHDMSLAFRHELGRLAVESTLLRGRARELHRSILQRLVEHNADLSQIVHHAVHSDDAAVLLEYAPRAARQAADAGAHREAAAHLATVINHSATLSELERARLLESHAIECDLTNQVSKSLESATRALALWRHQGDKAAQARVLLMIGMQQWKSGQKTQADRPVAEAIALLESLPPSRELAMAYSARAQRAMTASNTVETLEFGQRALDLAVQFGDHGVRSHALNNIGCVLICRDGKAGFAKLEQSLEVALEHNLHVHAGRAYANLASNAVNHHLNEIAERYLSEGLEYCEVHEVHDCLSYIRAYAAHLALNKGEWSTAAQAASTLVEQHSHATAQRIPALVTLALVRARRGDPGVDPLVDEAMRLALPTGELQRIGRVAAAAAEVAWYRGDLQRCQELVALGLKSGAGRDHPWLIGQLSFWGHRSGAAQMSTNDIPEPYQLMIQGQWVAAADAWAKRGMPYEQALALAEGAEDELRQALALLEQLGAGPLGAIVRQRLRERGVKGIPRGPRPTTRDNPAGLTSREVQVLSLLVAGHTNTELAKRLHVSIRTVDHHVSSILEKLEVRSRTEAVAAAFGLGIVKPAS